MSGNLNNLDRARVAWGYDLPHWVRLLVDACDRTNQRAVAERLGKSNGYVNRLIHHNYAGSYAEAEKQVRAVFGAEQVMCPLYGPMALKTCIANRRRTQFRNWLHVQFSRACPACPNNTDRPNEEED